MDKTLLQFQNAELVQPENAFILNQYIIVEQRNETTHEPSNFDKLVVKYNNKDVTPDEHKKMEAFLSAVKRTRRQVLTQDEKEQVYRHVRNPMATLQSVVRIIDRSTERHTYFGLIGVIIILSAFIIYLLTLLWIRPVIHDSPGEVFSPVVEIGMITKMFSGK